MNTTQTTLLGRVKDPHDALAWQEFHRLYSGLIYSYARERGLNDTDAKDVVADCMATLVSHMRQFDYDSKRCRFRSYLRKIVRHRVVNVLRKKRPVHADTADLEELQAEQAAPDEFWETQWELKHLLHCWKKLEKEASPTHAEIFRLHVVEEWPVKQVMAKLGVSANQVYQIKARLTQRLKLAMIELLGEEE